MNSSTTSMFREKMALLNQNFVQFLVKAFEATPSADFSPTVKDYMKHVEELDRIYGSSSEVPDAEATSRKDSVRKTLADVLGPSSTPSYTSSCIFKPQSTPISKPSETQKAPEPVTFASGGSRKRRNDTAIDKAFKARDNVSDDESDAHRNEPASTTQASRPIFPPAAKPFDWSGQRKDWGDREPELFSVAKEPAKSTEKASEKPPPPFLFGVRPTNGDGKEKSAETTTAPLSTTTAPSATFKFGQANSNGGAGATKTTGSPLFTIGPGKDGAAGEKTTSTKPPPPFLFGVQPSSDSGKDKPATSTIPTFAFAQTGSTTASGGSGFSLFGTTGKPSSTPLFPTSAPAGGSSAEKKDEDGGEEEKEEPPKVELVEHEEPDAIYSTKCVVFQFKNNEYKKFGVGSLHVKTTDDGKKQLLIRAATTVGTIWVNTLLNDNFKWSKVDEKKMRISYPNEVLEKGDDTPKLVMETFLVRVGGQPEMDKIVEHFPKKD